MNRLLSLFALALLAAMPTSAQGVPNLIGGFSIPLATNSGNPGDSLFVLIDVANVGTADAPAFPTAVYFSTDRFVSDDDTLITRVMVPGVPAQSNGGSGVRIAVPNVPRGGYRVLVALDDPNTVSETNETDNVNSALFTVSPAVGGPDLIPGDGDLEDETVAPGGRISVSYRVANAGPSAVGDFEAAYYLAVINRPPSEWILLERETLGGLDAFDDEDESEQVTIPASVPPGEYGFAIILDDRNLVAESIETNNDYGAGRITVTGTTANESTIPENGLSLRASPNPSGSVVRLSYALARPLSVRLVVTDALGREVAVVTNGAQGAGAHTATFDVSGLPAGVYAARLVTAEGTATVPLTVVR